MADHDHFHRPFFGSGEAAASRTELLASFDKNVAAYREALAGIDDGYLRKRSKLRL